jgi:hypothetical protein
MGARYDTIFGDAKLGTKIETIIGIAYISEKLGDGYPHTRNRKEVTI